MNPLKVKATGSPITSANISGLQTMTDAEVKNYIANVITEKFAADTDGTKTAEINITTNNSGSGISIGNFVDTVGTESIGTHPATGSTTSTTYYVKQVVAASTENVSNRPVGWDSRIKEASDSEIDVMMDLCIEAMVTESTHTAGQYRLQPSAPSGGTWVSRYTITDTAQGGNTVTYLWQKTTASSAPNSDLTPLRLVDGVNCKQMTESEIEQMLPNFRNRIIETGRGTYLLQSTAPSGAGTWVEMGSTFSDTREQITPQNYAGNFVGNFTGSFTGNYTNNFSNTFSTTNNYSSNFTGNYSGTASYSGFFSGSGNFAGPSYSGSYIGNPTFSGTFSSPGPTYSGNYSNFFSGSRNYAGNYAGNFSGNYVGFFSGSRNYAGNYAGTYSGTYGSPAFFTRVTFGIATYTGFYTGVGPSFLGFFAGTPQNYSGPSYTGFYSVGFEPTFGFPAQLPYTGFYSGPPINYAGFFSGPPIPQTFTGFYTSQFGQFPKIPFEPNIEFYTGFYSGVAPVNYAGFFSGPGNFTGFYVGPIPLNPYTGFYQGFYSGVSPFYTGFYSATANYAGFYSSPAVFTDGSFAGVINYTGNYTGFFAGSRTYAGNYVGGNFTGNYTGFFSGSRTYAGNYQGFFTGFYTGINNYTGPSFGTSYTGTYTGFYSGIDGTFTGFFSGPATYSGTYLGNFSSISNYTGNFTGSFSGSYLNSFSGTFTGNYSGATVQATKDTVSTVKLWIRTA